jgi:hypothetical protein
MSLSFEGLREWAIDRATDWALEPDGTDRLAIGDLRPAGPLRIESFNFLLPVATAAVGRPSDLEGTGLKAALKRRGADRAIRLLGMAGLARVQAPGPVTPRPIAFLSELATPSSLEAMLAVAAALPGDSFRPVSGDPRASRAWRAAGADPLPLIGDWRAAMRARGRAVPAARRRWSELLRRPPRFELEGDDLGPLALARLEPLVRRSVPWLAAERDALARRLDALQPRWLVVASDQHRLGRLAVALARERGIRTLVLQHGLPQYRLGFLPLAADEIATWSEVSDDWLAAGGAERYRLVRLGNPRLDALVRSDRAIAGSAVAREHGAEGRPRLLLTLSPNDVERNLALLELALGWLDAEVGAHLIVKLHPGDGRWDAVRRRIAEHPAAARVSLARQQPLYPLLHWADLVLLHRSTVAVEALAAGTPVAIGAVGAPSPDDSLPADLALPEVADPRGLRDLIGAVSEPAARARFLDERRTAIERTTGPLDGRVAERIADYLTGDRPGDGPA